MKSELHARGDNLLSRGRAGLVPRRDPGAHHGPRAPAIDQKTAAKPAINPESWIEFQLLPRLCAHQTVTSSRASTEISALKSLIRATRLSGVDAASNFAWLRQDMSQQVEWLLVIANARRPFGKLSLRASSLSGSSLSCRVARKRHGKAAHVERPEFFGWWCLTRFKSRANEYWASCKNCSVDNDPLPLLTSPRQTAVAPFHLAPFQSDQFDGI